jgi:hypothetical protein
MHILDVSIIIGTLNISSWKGEKNRNRVTRRELKAMKPVDMQRQFLKKIRFLRVLAPG